VKEQDPSWILKKPSEVVTVTNYFLGIVQNLAVLAERGSSFCLTLHIPKCHLTSKSVKLKYFPKYFCVKEIGTKWVSEILYYMNYLRIII
jgi:hypothetical protein